MDAFAFPTQTMNVPLFGYRMSKDGYSMAQKHGYIHTDGHVAVAVRFGLFTDAVYRCDRHAGTLSIAD